MKSSHPRPAAPAGLRPLFVPETMAPDVRTGPTRISEIPPPPLESVPPQAPRPASSPAFTVPWLALAVVAAVMTVVSALGAAAWGR
jgi:hypothetical protein